ncbi:MAG TPA: hypothetical protein VGS97_26140 [Actinocrinis sp.]|uniref:hypothetical protein n=1 Tax=Actinocrinis sp. TaxID=1920516 RepID=UPI002DDD0270|nr:hypothetical protein [Actinocrinis sp.]HEV2347599.1 hypothetical protein [Actinocrinis sp.]
MTITERFAGRADGTEWRGVLQDQLAYRELAAHINEFPWDRSALCNRSRFCILAWHHSGPCLAFMQLQNIPRDPTLPPEHQDPETSA